MCSIRAWDTSVTRHKSDLSKRLIKLAMNLGRYITKFRTMGDGVDDAVWELYL